jgi:hypothetical protein
MRFTQSKRDLDTIIVIVGKIQVCGCGFDLLSAAVADADQDRGIGSSRLFAIRAADVDDTMGGEFREDEVDFGSMRVVGVDEKSDAVGMSGSHFEKYGEEGFQIEHRKTSRRLR